MVRVAENARFVQIRIPWRRRDANPQDKEIIVVDAKTNQRVANVVRIDINREFGWLLFEPPTAPGEYYVYYMPFRNEGSWYFPTAKYLPPTETATAAWLTAAKMLAARLQRGEAGAIPTATVVEIQAINDFHRFDPMEVIATAQEMKQLLAANADRPYLLFAEDRKFPIRMADDLPQRWIKTGPSMSFSGSACRGEFYAFQIGVYASQQRLEGLGVEFGDLTLSSGKHIPATSIRCFNLGGTDWLGRSFHKEVAVPRGKVQPLWFGIAVPKDAAAGTYRGTLTFRAKDVAATTIQLTLQVSDQVLEDAGDSEAWRHSRLRWLDSTLGLDDELVEPFKPVSLNDRTVSILGRSARIGDTGLLAGITSTFGRNVDRVDAPPRELLAAPMQFVVQPAAGSSLAWKPGPLKIVSQAPGAIAWETVSQCPQAQLTCRAKMECDGYVNFRLALKAREALDLKDIALLIPLRREMAVYQMGMGCKGGYRPKSWQWKWDINRANNQVWIGDVNAGISCKLKHKEDRWDLYNLRESGTYRDWSNDGGGCTISEEGADQVVLRAYTGARKVSAGDELQFNFGLLITPLKMLDKDHWKWRYYQGPNGAAPVAAIASQGATVINVHQGDRLNPYINYPFAAVDTLKPYITEAHAKNIKVKIYYTIRELSNYTTEFWALRSLGDEVYMRGEGFKLADQFEKKPTAAVPTLGGGSWLREHAVDTYVPAWHTPLGNGRCDAAIATVGLSRWHNYYVEGLSWLIRNAGVDGLYLDGVGYDREIMKRVRKTMQRARPGCLIDFHSGNNYHPEYGLNNPANQYMELFPYIDSLWLGEGFNYGESPDYYLVEVSGIPYGLFGEMLDGGGNPWRGMLYGMTNRLGWCGDPRPLWKLWDNFGIQEASMSGYWDPDCPVKTGRKDVLATAYVRNGKTLVAIASWAPEPVSVKLDVAYSRLKLDPAKTEFFAAKIAGLQAERIFKPGEPIPVAPGRGWLLVIDEQSHARPPAVEVFPERKELLAERFTEGSLPEPWHTEHSKQPDTSIRVSRDGLRIQAAANAAAFVERPIPAGARAVVCSLNQQSDQGATWGPGMSLVWRNGKVLRVNVRCDGHFGVDDGGRQIIKESDLADSWVTLAILLQDSNIVVQATDDGRSWQEIARFGRTEFPGEPIAVRLGKMDARSENHDFSTLGPAGATTIRSFRVLGE